MSTISFIIPAYNAEKFIGEAIESALNQTRPAKEIIVVDDASTDRTVEIARGFGERVKVLVNEKNSGPGHSRNAGVAASAGDYLAFLDADDILLNQHLEIMGGLLDRWPEAGMAISCIKRFGFGEACPGPVWRCEPCLDKPADLFALAMRGYLVHTCNHVYRKTAFHNVSGFRELDDFTRGRRIQVEDNDLFFRLSSQTQIVASREPTVLYRLHPDQSSRQAPGHTLLWRYRMRLLRELKRGKSRLYGLGLDRARRGWEEKLDRTWTDRDYRMLRSCVLYGLHEPDLRKITCRYVFRALTPGWVVGFHDLVFRRVKNQAQS